MTRKYLNIEHINLHSSAVFKEIAEKNGFFDVRFITEWREIVGSEIANRCLPSKIKYNALQRTITLFISTEDMAFKNLFTYYKDMILGRVRLYFGINNLVDVKIQI